MIWSFFLKLDSRTKYIVNLYKSAHDMIIEQYKNCTKVEL